MRILIIKTSALGDIIQAFPALFFLSHVLPDAKIDWVVKKPYVELLAAHPLVHRALEPNDLKKSCYDLVFDLQGNIKSGLMLSRVKAEDKVGFSFKSAPEWPNALFTTKRYPLKLDVSIRLQYLSVIERHFSQNAGPINPQVKLQISENEQRWVKERLEEEKSPRLMICLGSTWENKKLSLGTWEVLLKQLEKKYSPSFYFAWGAENERVEAEALSAQVSSKVLPRMTLPVWQHMMAGMDGILSVDSSALHLAETCGIPTFSFFGPSRAAVYKPQGKIHSVFEGTCPYGIEFTKRCPKLRTCSSGACLKDVQVKALLSQLMAWANLSKSI